MLHRNDLRNQIIIFFNMRVNRIRKSILGEKKLSIDRDTFCLIVKVYPMHVPHRWH